VTLQPFAPPAGTGTPLTAAGYQQLGGAHDKLTAWYSALAARSFAEVNVMCLGDSSLYQNATVWGRDWPSALTRTLNTRFPTQGLTTHGRGWLPLVLPGQPFTSGISSTNYLTLTGTPGAVSGLGVNLNAWDLSADGGVTAVYDLVGTTAYVVYATQPDGGLFTWQLDSGDVNTVSTASDTVIDGAAFPVTLGGGSHTLTIAYDSGGLCFFEGVAEYNGDENSGIVSYNGGCSGSTSGDWAAMFADPTITNPGGSIADFAPSVVILFLGANDFSASVPVATFQANMEAVITGVRTAVTTLGISPEPSFLLISAPDLGSGWPEYADALYVIAEGDSAVDVIDLEQGRFPALAAADTFSLYDTGEFSDNGHGYLADILAQFLGPA
jgi:GDSL-like Lipase/Acylhydrolase family